MIGQWNTDDFNSLKGTVASLLGHSLMLERRIYAAEAKLIRIDTAFSANAQLLAEQSSKESDRVWYKKRSKENRPYIIAMVIAIILMGISIPYLARLARIN